MNIKVRTQNNDDKTLLAKDRVNVVVESTCDIHETWSWEEFQTWLDAFRNRYAEALEYLREH